MLKPFSMYSPPTKPGARTLLILGEAPGEEEEAQGKPFVGARGKLLDEVLQMAGLDRAEFHVLNVFSQRPPNNELKAWTITKTDLKKAGYSEQGRLPQLNKRYLHPEYEPHLERLRSELWDVRPAMIIALGGTALWALTGDGRISQHRGTFFNYTQTRDVTASPEHDIEAGQAGWQCTCIASFHPAMVLRAWENRPILWADLLKAKRWLNGTLTSPLRRKVWINPTEEELRHVYQNLQSDGGKLLGVDIETAPGCDQITTFAIGSAEEGICIPLWDRYTLPGMCNVYEGASGEASAWRWIRTFCELPNPKVMQNGLYDMQYLLDAADIRPVNVLHDTAIMQHAMQPELPKDLGTLASLYLNEPSWKFMRESAKDANKADE